MKPRLPLLTLFAFAFTSGVYAQTETVSATAQRYRNLRLASAASAVENVTFKQDFLVLALTRGSASEVMAGDEKIGIYFRGTGTLSYTSTDPDEFLVLQHNLRQGAKLQTDVTKSAITISTAIEEVLILAGGAPVPELTGAAAGTLEREFAAHREAFGRDAARATEHPFVERNVDWKALPYVRVEASSKAKTRLVYTFDPFAEESVSLFSLHPAATDVPELKRYFSRSLISQQPLGRNRRDPLAPPYLLTALDYTLTASNHTSATLACVETIVPQSRARRILRFRMNNWIWANRLRQQLITVKSVRDAAGNDLAFDHHNDELLVGLAKPAPAGKPLQLTFDISGDYLVRPAGDNFWQLGIEPWFPQPELNGSFHTVHAVVKVEGSFVPFAPGRTVQRKREIGYNIVETVVERPVQSAVVHAGKYVATEEQRDGVTVRIASYAAQNKTATKRLIGLAFDVIKFYEFLLGPFPFPEFNIIEVPQYGWGQAPAGTMFITRELFDRLDPGYGFTELEVNSRFAHEIAHQYWGEVVKMPSFEEQWITEAFADYSAALFLQQAYGKQGKAQFERIRATWKGNAAMARNDSSIALANRLATPNEPPLAHAHRRWLLYDKGPLLLDAIRKEIGEDQFLTFMRSFQKSFAWKFGSTKDVAGLLTYMTKKDYAPFFEQYYWGSDSPR